MREWERRGLAEKEAVFAVNLLEENGYEAFFVGGCVRDILSGKEPEDVDIATSARPEQTKEIFSLRGFQVVETGIKHGTVTALVGGVPLEITTYRVDGTYTDHRRPDAVTFTSDLAADLARRDFTINAMAWSPSGGLVDVFGGREDLKNGVLRCVGEPSARFCEDALRILRALRFSARLGFQIEERTEAAVFAEKDLLKAVSSERVFSELKKILAGKYAEKVLLRYASVLGTVIPEILPMAGFEQNNPHHIYDVWTHTVKVLEGVKEIAGENPEAVGGSLEGAEGVTGGGSADRMSVRPSMGPEEAHAEKRREIPAYLLLAALFHDIGKPASYTQDQRGVGHFYGHAKKSVELADSILLRLKADNATRERVIILIRYHDARMELTTSAVKRWLNRLGEEVFRELIWLQRADNLAQNLKRYNYQQRYRELLGIAEALLQAGACLSLTDLAIGGRDLLAAGFSEGPEIGAALKLALNAVLDGEVENEKEELLRFVRGRLHLFQRLRI